MPFDSEMFRSGDRHRVGSAVFDGGEGAYLVSDDGDLLTVGFDCFVARFAVAWYRHADHPVSVLGSPRHLAG